MSGLNPEPPERTLEEVLAEKGALPAETAVAYALELLSALAELHREGVEHGAVTAQSVIVFGDGTLRLVDWQRQRLLPADAPPFLEVARRHFSDAVRLGSIQYFPPEALQGLSAGAGADLYAAGVVLYRMLTGRLPYGDGDELEICERIAAGVPPTAPSVHASGIPAAVENVVLRAIARDPRRRYGSAPEFRSALVAASRAPG